MQQGVTNEDACRIVGVNSTTGRRWRDGRGPSGQNKAVPPVRPVAPPSAASSRCLSQDERIYIADRIRENAAVRAVAAELGRSPSTVSRETRRNRTTSPTGQWHYRPCAVQARTEPRRPRRKPRKIHQNPELRDFVQTGLDRRWSPEQSCHALKAQFPDRPETHLVHETAYQALYVQGRGELRREVARARRSRPTRRKPQRQTRSRRPGVGEGPPSPGTRTTCAGSPTSSWTAQAHIEVG
ncbi:helix-turn-helix domain-containing protein [Streptomyces sp. NPDC006655]|uniref:helix-turn-helix domain-containing protein n=1 Tax=Streptomyces sp. NPDC006655 TaxID=3156898 RepID=UPI003456EF08